MRNYQAEQQQDQQVLQHLAGREPLSLGEIAKEMQLSEFDLRKSLMRLRDRGDVRKFYADEWVYERTHGGYGPGPGEAA